MPRLITPERRGRTGMHATWRAHTRDGAPRSTTLVSCPRCGEDTELQQLVLCRDNVERPLYRINQLGVVSPRFDCSAGCGFKAIIELQQWSAVIEGLV